MVGESAACAAGFENPQATIAASARLAFADAGASFRAIKRLSWARFCEVAGVISMFMLSTAAISFTCFKAGLPRHGGGMCAPGRPGAAF
jgi:hypothetical protein